MMPPHLLRDYQAAEELARTPSAVLLRARRVRDGLPVLITSTVADEPSFEDVAAFEREFEIRRGLDVRGVPPVLELVRDGRHRALVVTDPGGQLLSTVIASEPIDLASRLRLAAEIARLLAGLHAQDYMVGVLAPWFALVGPQGDVSLVGLARGGTPGLPPPHVTLSESDRQSLPYVSPELTGRLKRAVDHRSDLYSLGIVLYELLSGAPPFRSADAQELVHWHLARTPALPIAADPRVEGALAAILRTLLAKTPEDRYQSAAGVAADIESCIAGLDGSTALTGFQPGTRDRQQPPDDSRAVVRPRAGAAGADAGALPRRRR